jgi:nitrogen fixation/metabolism regulation signal transduction histidine kinase
MTTSAPTAQGATKYKRSFKNYLLDARFQLKWTGFIIIVALAVSAIMGVFLYRTSSEVTRASQKVLAQGEALLKESRTNSDLVAMQISEKYQDAPELAATFDKEAKERAAKLEAQHQQLLAQQQETAERQTMMMISLVAGLSLLVVFIGLLGIYFTHKVVGPIHMMKGLLRQVGDGKLNFNRKPRKGDELQDFFEVFASMVEKLKERQRREVELLTDAIGEAQRISHPDLSKGAEVDDDALAKIREVRDEMKAALDL